MIDDGAVQGEVSDAGVEAGASAIVHWAVPPSNGSAITSYLVTSFANGVAISTRSYAAPASAASVTGLTYGKSYAFRVAATNTRGASPRSLRSWPLALSCAG